MIKVNLKRPYRNLDLSEVPDSDMGKHVAQQLANAGSGPAIKFLDWAMALQKSETLVLDSSDFKLLYDFIDTSDKLTVLARGQLLKTLLDAKDSSESPKL